MEPARKAPMTEPINFAIAAADLRRQEVARIAATVTPTLDSLRVLTLARFRDEIALMMERLGHTIITDPTAADLVTLKEGRKFITECARPADLTPARMRDLVRLHEGVIAANAQAGIYVTLRSFTADAQEYAATAPLKLVDAEILKRSMQRSLKGVLLPLTYKAMCCQCGEIVQHRLSKGEALPCNNGHMVAPTIARASLQRRKSAAGQFSRREIRAHNYKYEARMMKKPRGG
jgi:hypothetical protein